MEASGSTPTPPPEGESTPADAPAATTPTAAATPPPPPTGTPDDGKARRRLARSRLHPRFGSGFAGAVIAAVMVDLANGPLCKDVVFTPAGPTEDCWDVSSAGRVVSELFGWPAVALAAVGLVLGLMFAFTGRRGPLLLRVTVAAIVFGAISIFIDQIL